MTDLDFVATVVLGLFVLTSTILGLVVTAAIDTLLDRRTPPGEVPK